MTAMPESPDVLYHPLNPEHTGNPEQRLNTARATCPVSTPAPRLHVVATNELVREVLTDPERFYNRGNFTVKPDPPKSEHPIITSMDGEQHRDFRTFMRRWFAPIELRKQEGRIEQIVSRLIEGLQPGQAIEFIGRVARPLPAWTVFAFVGLPEKDWEDIQRWTDTIHDHLPRVPVDLPERLSFVRYLDELVADRAAHPESRHGDLIDGLVFEPGISATDAAAHISQILNAGTATTTSLISNLFYALLHDRDNWQKLLADPTLVNAAVEESLRCDAPLQYALRMVVDDTEIGGCPVQAGDRLAVSLQSANWDESVWGDDAGDYRLDRGTPEAIMTFGNGIHNCLGAPLARLEAQVLLRQFLHSFPDVKLADGYERVAAHDPMLRRPMTLEVVL